MFYNFVIIGFIIALIVLSIFWAFNAVRRIEIEKNFCDVLLYRDYGFATMAGLG